MQKISVIVPVYKVEQYLEDCIESVLCQTMPDWELILVDDGSPDRSGEICDHFSARDPRIRTIHQPNQGLPAARNSGARAARGEYLVFVDSDDYFNDPRFFEILSSSFDIGVQVILYGMVRQLEGDPQRKKYRTAHTSPINGLTGAEQVRWLIENEQFAVSAYLHAVQRDFFLEHELWFDESFRTGEDIEWSLRMLTFRPQMMGLDLCPYTYRIRRESLCTGKRAPGFWRNRHRAIESGVRYAKGCSDEPVLENAMLGYLAYLYYVMLAEIPEEPDPALKKEAFEKCRQLQWLGRYALGRKAKLSRLAVGLMGQKLGARLLHLRVRSRRRTG